MSYFQIRQSTLVYGVVTACTQAYKLTVGLQAYDKNGISSDCDIGMELHFRINNNLKNYPLNYITRSIFVHIKTSNLTAHVTPMCYTVVYVCNCYQQQIADIITIGSDQGNVHHGLNCSKQSP